MSCEISYYHPLQVEPAQGREFAIDNLLAGFHQSVDAVAGDPKKYGQMIEIVKEHNPFFTPIQVETVYPNAEVLATIVAGIYAPLIHGFAGSVVINIKEGNLPHVVIAPPRDAIPLAVAIQAQAKIQEVDVQLLSPHINRNTAGIANNQKGYFVGRSPYLDHLFDQTVVAMNGSVGATEVETGIYGTTSLVMAEAFKSRKLEQYYPIKFYGLGPNLSYVHAILSGGREWVAEEAESNGLVDISQVRGLMVLLDTMEELGMEKWYKSVEHLKIDEQGLVVPVIVPVTDEEAETAKITNQVIAMTAPAYAHISGDEIQKMLANVPTLISYAKEGFPFTLTEPIPSMDSKEEHYKKIRESGLFDYPNLVL